MFRRAIGPWVCTLPYLVHALRSASGYAKEASLTSKNDFREKMLLTLMPMKSSLMASFEGSRVQCWPRIAAPEKQNVVRAVSRDPTGDMESASLAGCRPLLLALLIDWVKSKSDQ
uniref:Secreted protein n=1 Tax=Rhodosorus marinus TaxID=101924 RepID=A0A7S3E8S8_9RHOD